MRAEHRIRSGIEFEERLYDETGRLVEIRVYALRPTLARFHVSAHHRAGRSYVTPRRRSA